MSKEAVGRNGYMLGTEIYFKKLNQDFDLDDVADISQGYRYYDGLRELASHISSLLSTVYSDVKRNAKIMPYISERDREETAELAIGLGEVCHSWGSSSSDADRIVSIVTLSASEARKKSSESANNIERAAKKIKSGSYSGVSSSEKVRLVEKAISSSVEKAAGDDVNKLNYLRDVEQGKGSRFLEDVLQYYEYIDRSSSYSGRNGKQVCSSEYNRWIENEAFESGFPKSFSYGYSKKYAYEIKRMLQSICDELEDDLKDAERAKDYIRDENGETIKKAVEQLERAGISCYGVKSEVEKLMWYVGGNSYRIQELQKNLNTLGVSGDSGRLKEDGVFGKETLSAWGNLLSRLASGAVPILCYVDILQSDLTGITHYFEENGRRPEKGKILQYYKMEKLPDKYEYSILMQNGKELFRLDRPHMEDGEPLDYHINYKPIKHEDLNKRLNRKFIKEETFLKLKDFQKIGKVFRIAGKKLLVAGVLLDTLELGEAVVSDLNDADRKLGRTTITTGISIGGRWAGAAVGAKGGAMAGAAIGTAIFPGPGTAVLGAALGLAGGILGATGAEKVTEWAFDISELED